MKPEHICLLIIALSFPLCTLAVFGFGFDRSIVANFLSIIFSFLLYAAILFPFFTSCSSSSSSSSSASTSSPLQRSVTTWIFFTSTIHCTWELGWLLLEKQIRSGKDNPVFYPWTAYIEGGDARYVQTPLSTFVFSVEILSVINGLVGFLGLYLFHLSSCEKKQTSEERTKKNQRSISSSNSSSSSAAATRLRLLAFFLMIAQAQHHLSTASLYFLTEAVDGFKSVGNDFVFDFLLKFFFVNSPWLIFPFFVFYFCFSSILMKL